jgi:ElaB/YqjD/DUF883 family membrane-anchored ribosome-binding protein
MAAQGTQGDVLQAKAEELREGARDLYERGKQRAIQWEESFEDAIAEQPVRSVLVAAGVGAVVGLVLGITLARR